MASTRNGKKRKQSTVKLILYIQSFLAISAIESFLNAILNHQFVNLLISVLLSGGSVFLYRKSKTIKKEEIVNHESRYEGYVSDNSYKRFCNLISIFICDFFIVILNFTISCSIENSKFVENITSIRPSIHFMECLLLFSYVSWKELVLLGNCSDLSKKKHYIQRSLVITSIYWIIYLIVSLVAGVDFYNRSKAFVIIMYALMLLVSNIFARKKVTVRNFYWKKAYTFCIIGFVLFITISNYLRRDTFYLQGYINQIARLQQNTVPIEYDDETGTYRIEMVDDDFKILQLTDIHFGGSLYSLRKDYMALNTIYDLIEYAKPDLVVVTGDMTFPLGIMSLSFNNSSAVHQFAAFMRNINVPWVFTFGNHDTEVMSSYNQGQLCELYESLSFKTSGTLLYPYIQPDITGRSNQVIELYNKDHSLNQALFIIDSNAYTGEGINVFDYIHDDQVEWYENEVKRLCEQEGKTISSLAFFHIPLQEYRTAYELYESGSNEVKYFFGNNDEEMINKVCCSDYPSGLFEKMKELDSTKAVFCGHDHYNNMSLEYQGIRLTYGMSIDYLAMPGIDKSEKQRGGTLITIYADSTYTIEQIPFNKID